MLPYKYVLKATYNISIDNPIVHGTIINQNIADYNVKITIGIKNNSNNINTYGLLVSIIDNNNLQCICEEERFYCNNRYFKEENVANEISDIINTYCFNSIESFYFDCMFNLDTLVNSINGKAFILFHSLKNYTYGINIKAIYFKEYLQIGYLEPIIRKY